MPKVNLAFGVEAVVILQKGEGDAMEITKQRLAQLEKAERKLNALEAGGVDNWEWYGEAMDKLIKEDEYNEKVEDIVSNIMQILGENVDEPAGHGAGYGFKDNAMDEALTEMHRGLKALARSQNNDWGITRLRHN